MKILEIWQFQRDVRKDATPDLKVGFAFSKRILVLFFACQSLLKEDKDSHFAYKVKLRLCLIS